jgi:hypothetical protein
VQIKGCIGVNAAVCPNQLPTLTLVEPVSINSNNGVTPSTLVAGTTTNVTIAGGGFGTSPTVTFTNPSWGTTGYSCPTVSNTSITCSVTVPANLSNMTGTTPITATVSATTDGLTTSATSSSISITPIAYTYTLSLTSSSPSPLTYGEVATITPHVACKTTSGTVCSGSVSNPQEAVFSYTGVGSLYPSGLATAATYAASTMLPSAQNSVVTIQGCLPASDGGGGCMTQTFNIAATTITLNPPAMSGPMTSAKTQGFSATIQNPGTANQLTWTLTPAGTAYGSLTSSTSAITGSTTSGTSGTTNAPADTYTPPTTITTAAAVTMSVCMTANTSICATPVVIQLPGFSITATNNNPSQTALSLGHSMSYAINVSALDGFNGTVALSVGGLPTGVTAKLSAPSITTSTSGSVTLTLTSAYSTSTYIGNSTISVTGSSGSMAVPASIPLTTRPLQYAGQCNVPTTISKFYPNPLYPY